MARKFGNPYDPDDPWSAFNQSPWSSSYQASPWSLGSMGGIGAIQSGGISSITSLGTSYVHAFDYESLFGRTDPFGGTAAAKGGKSGGGSTGGGDTGGGDTGGGGTGTVYTTYNAGAADGEAGYDIIISFKGTGWTQALQTPFIQMADYLTSIITNDIGGPGVYRRVLIDDLYVTAEVKTIDGVGGILGQAGPSAVWTATELTAAGVMQFDIADAIFLLDNKYWDDVVTHEFMHVLGFGTLWNYGADPLVANNQYTGANGLAAFNTFLGGGNKTYIPVENDGGSGTAGGHWDEQAFYDLNIAKTWMDWDSDSVVDANEKYSNELMTGYLNGQSTLSKFSVMSLADLGYNVEYSSYGGLTA